MEIKSILIVGVGGQGVLRASDILCKVIMNSGLDVKKSEVHGMAQRGGCVTSHVRFGEKVFSPLSKKHDIDILVSFEKMETLRYLDYLKDDGIVIVNTEEIYPPAVNIGVAAYPADVIKTLQGCFKTVKEMDALSLARQAGSVRAVNTVLLGALSNYLQLSSQSWQKALQESFPAKLLELNRQAFQWGTRC